MDQFNQQQKAAIQHHGSALLVLAGAGSGKTRVITEKIAWLIRTKKVPAEKITAVTFTNKAAREMKSRVAGIFKGSDQGKNANKGVKISTFHSLGMRILRKDAEHVELRSGFSIIDPSDAVVIVNDILAESGPRDAEFAQRIYNRISMWKNLGLRPEQVLAQGPGDDAPDPIHTVAVEIYPRYNRYLRACNSVDLDDLIFLPTQLLQDNEQVRQSWQKQIEYLLIDEYQDTNGAQYELVKNLVGDGSRLTVVGDDDQSIYSWRGAQPENMLRLDADYPGMTLIKLEQNYRSAGRILKIANEVISNNPRPFTKTLWSELGYGDVVKIESARNDEVEAEKIVSAIMSHQFRYNSEHRDFAILYRSNHQARILETKLREMRIPYRLSGGMSFFDRSEIRDIMAYLRLLVNPADDTAFLRIINVPRRGVGATTLEKITELAATEKSSLLETLLDPKLSESVNARQHQVLRDFAERMIEDGDNAARGDPVKVINSLLEDIGYERWLMESGDESAAETRWENVISLVDWIASMAENPQGDDESDSGLSSILAQVILSDILDKQNDDTDRNEVSLMTLHASKGLEFKHVFVVGVEEEILPHRVSVAEDGIDEERRLFYVGITRAMQTLTLSHCRVRRRYGETISCDPSRFLDELPSDEIQWQDKVEVSEEEKQATGKSHLAMIRAGLSQGK